MASSATIFFKTRLVAISNVKHKSMFSPKRFSSAFNDKSLAQFCNALV